MAQRFDYLLLGGGTCCGYASAAIRELDKNGSIGIVSAEDQPPYDRPPFSKNYLVKDAMTPDDAHSKDESFYPENNIELLLGTPVVRLDRVSKGVHTADGREIGYGKLLYALGSEPRPLPGPGGEHVQLLRSYSDSEAIRTAARGAKRAIVIGGGWIGPEVASSLTSRGVAVVLVAREPNIWERVPSRTSGEAVERELRRMGVEVVTGASAASVNGNRVHLSDGRSIDADMVVAGVGASPRTHLAKDAGLAMGASGVAANASLQTEDESIWVAGDVAEFDSVVLGKPYRAEHHLHAKASGAHAGKGMAGDPSPFMETPYFYSDVGELSYIQRGFPELSAKSFVYGDPNEPVITEVFLFNDNRVAGVSDIRRDFKAQDPISNLFADLVRDRATLSADTVAKMSSPDFDVLSLGD
jgi:NAD(P)H-nitrite reductase large subunit